jgi:hypothetical protein
LCDFVEGEGGHLGDVRCCHFRRWEIGDAGGVYREVRLEYFDRSTQSGLRSLYNCGVEEDNFGLRSQFFDLLENSSDGVQVCEVETEGRDFYIGRCLFDEGSIFGQTVSVASQKNDMLEAVGCEGAGNVVSDSRTGAEDYDGSGRHSGSFVDKRRDGVICDETVWMLIEDVGWIEGMKCEVRQIGLSFARLDRLKE